ncbi:MAG: HD domain-containing protein [Aigarchaeota archaeon]|nr:HD domain-containing protein [Aigarchaeota archaeon]
MIETEVKRLMKGGESSGHDWEHVRRVQMNCLALARSESANLNVLRLAAILHDVGITWEMKQGLDHAVASARTARRIMRKHGVPSAIVEAVCRAIASHRYGAGLKPNTVEGRILQDADRLDAIGAIGVARAFAYGGARGAAIYDPSEKPGRYNPMKVTSTLTHFHEKLLKIKDSMNTRSGRQIARERHRFMAAFLRKLQEEISGVS